ncbi:hypothetical protein N7516_011339 [Penicillium verrucosum]|uniref:uncharacterized protein n=1 Tax=Penicillium verrucosum TaxID=60171 RepID=UPI002545322A|nr:uncharacterized protein N7516_011339 [Penicillium verrucosum]KAJ5920481.1 hypothetical protein N7516_011339 [Penicillium verrucosum]
MSSPAKPILFPGISATETKLLVLANVCLKNDKTRKIDYDKLAANAGIKASSAHTLFRTAKRKLDKLCADDHTNADDASATMSPEGSSSKRRKANAKTPRTIKSPKTSMSPKTPKSAKATKSDKAAINSEETDDQDVSIKLEFSPLTADFEFAAALAEDTTQEAAVAAAQSGTETAALAEDTTCKAKAAVAAAQPGTETAALTKDTTLKAPVAAAEPVGEPAAAESLTELSTTADAIKPDTEKEQANVKADENSDAVLDLAVDQQLPESPLHNEEDDAYKQENAQKNDQPEN